MTPIEKNVIVVDESGNEYEATYPKRAKGLVKNGRARFVSENKICLACPPNKTKITEDIKMTDNMNIEETEAMETVEVAETTEIAENTATKYTIDYVLEQIENLRIQITESSYYSLHRLGDAVYSVYQYGTEDNESEESRNSSVACVCEIYRERENTLKQMLAFYEKMYDDLKPKPVDPINEATKRVLTEFISHRADYVAGCDITAEAFETVCKEIQQARLLVENK